jgi:hypothetical protein
LNSILKDIPNADVGPAGATKLRQKEKNNKTIEKTMAEAVDQSVTNLKNTEIITAHVTQNKNSFIKSKRDILTFIDSSSNISFLIRTILPSRNRLKMFTAAAYPQR